MKNKLNEQFTISVITPVFNAENTLQRTIDSIKMQKDVIVEYIIIDGLSSDNTISIVRKNKEFINTFVSEKDEGLYDAINKGIKLSTSDLIMVLNADDYYKNEFVLSKYLKEYNKYGEAVYFSYMQIGEDSDANMFTYRAKNFKKKLFMYKGCDIPHPTTMIPKHTYEKLGLYNSSFKILGDYDLLLRYQLSGKIKFIEIDFISVVFQRGGLSSSFFKNLLEAHKVRKNNRILFPTNLFFSMRSLIYFIIWKFITFLGIDSLINKKTI